MRVLHRSRYLLVPTLSCLVLPLATAADLMVDAAGHNGTYTTIAAAMAVAKPHDRILVEPGHYPPFQFFVGVDVIGLGSSPSHVVIDRVDYHVSTPNVGYDTLLSNVTVGSGNPTDAIAISGNELPPGTFHLDGTIVDGAVFLGGGATGFYALITNCRIQNAAGEGFSGEAFYAGGPNNYIEVRDSLIVGAAATMSAPPSAAMRIGTGSRVRLIHAELRGGDGLPGSAFPAGADAVIPGFAPGTYHLRIDGGSVIRAGDGFAAPGGDGVTLAGTIDVGAATVTGGAGTPPGLAYADAGPTPLPVDLHLTADPALANANGPVALVPGQQIGFAMNSPLASTVLVVAFDVNLPGSGLFLPLLTTSAFWIPGNSFAAQIPAIASLDYQGLEIYAQGLTLLPSGQLLFSDTASLRIDWAP